MFFQKIASLHRKIVFNVNKLLKPFGLNLSDWRVFLYLSQAKSSALVPICEFYGVDKAILTRAVSKLHKLGFIEFLDSQDKREKIIALSSKGKEIYYDVNFCIRDYEAKILHNLESKEREFLVQIIDKINQNFDSKDLQ
ncbi:hypothetical protein CQA49_01285 [Helicobacter sp. MIT 00-7814]|uniref:MarR family winged helix-turn-helix transcriptional regulator n=1 Tax=unclassified Helicobacter TaxID=2593540 RepID=UPI000E1E6017|nr:MULTISPECIES: MarR family winged helix-turn-helix transcriptional regulator [unclassified Helicobacter]RDU53293.1 hypothetical protein CQA37_07200 [Helicobacter sp. MIT 99-10781]RDU56954.1 hypothetical protein CQA49_01285 [Helicobacter sp. MIT 00-7814]